ncbi:MAG: S46 family peptidase [Melioribacteraceae bacterium]|nr:S46 family peptidase [Melioribacteraceae bacterium]
MKKIKNILLIPIFLFISILLNAQTIYEPVDLSKVKFDLKEMGTMWTFDAIPFDYFEKEYGFRPTQEWLDYVMKAALQFTNGCSAAFVSADGLIMTNHHCARNLLLPLSPKGENYLRDGYYAGTIAEEIKVPEVFVDQLTMIVDVTDEVLQSFRSGTTDAEKVKNRSTKISEIENKFSEETGLVCKVIELYKGGKYSLYGYKRYRDIRLVMAPDFQIAATGWDWDNFTYPRYELDFMFFRAYEDNKPVKTEYYFKFSDKGAEEDEPIFVIGRPGSTQRLLSVAQLEFFRDKQYKYTLGMFNELYNVSFELFQAHPEKLDEMLNSVLGVGNGRKSFAGRYMGLRDELIMAKKRDFEKNLIEKVNSVPELKSKYGHIWESIKNAINETNDYIDEYMALSMAQRFRNSYSLAAQNAITFANQMKLPEDKREKRFSKDSLKVTIEKLFPRNIDHERDNKTIRAMVNFLNSVLGTEHYVTKDLFGGNKSEDAVKYFLSNSNLSSKEKFVKFLKESKPDQILNSKDPMIGIVNYATKKLNELEPKYREVQATLSVLNQLLGEVVFSVYGDQTPPDATSSLRISDGRIAGYEYNGTLAPGKTTYFGLWDRWYSFGKKAYPWGLHPKWQTIPEGFDLSVPIGFASTNDIVGGNSGSSVINRNKEVVGLVHDGNLESLAGDFIFLESNNRTVATDSWGLMEALKFIYKTERLVNELEQGKIY